MKVFVAGGAGVVGRHLIPELVARGHDVTATTTSAAKLPALGRAGACPLRLDILDREAVLRALTDTRPDVVVHEATALAGPASLRRFDEYFARTNRLRTEGTANLLAGAAAAGAGRVVAQSFTGWPNARDGARVKDESDPLDPDPPAAARETLAAIRALEAAVAADAVAGVVLRYGTLYGPGTAIGAGGELLELVRRGRLPLVGRAGGVWSFVHAADVAAATVAAIEGEASGVYNVVDDDPAEVAEWLPYLARVLGARPPRRIPTWVARLVIGEHGVAMMTQMRGASNAKAKQELGWRPGYATWRDGFRRGLGLAAEAASSRAA
jgi:2-alkyl-3-oxoalkanoate reductase